jgi:hypothetical protein
MCASLASGESRHEDVKDGGSWESDVRKTRVCSICYGYKDASSSVTLNYVISRKSLDYIFNISYFWFSYIAGKFKRAYPGPHFLRLRA